MRLLLSILIAPLAGCSLLGQEPTKQPVAQHCDPTADQECSPCEGGGIQGWIARHTFGSPLRHKRYKSIEDNLATKTKAVWLAHCNLNEFEDKNCVTCDYKAGYEQAFVDVAQGACGDVPALPPPPYWKQSARSPEGHQKVQQWFNGYAAGAARAKAVYEPYNKVAHSQFECQDWSNSRWGGGD